MSTNKHLMVIWRWHPENVQVYLIPYDAITAEQLDVIKKAHGFMININGDTSNDGLAFLNQALLQDTEQNRLDNEEERFSEYIGLFHKYKTYDEEKDRTGNVFDKEDGVLVGDVVITGFAY